MAHQRETVGRAAVCIEDGSPRVFARVGQIDAPGYLLSVSELGFERTTRDLGLDSCGDIYLKERLLVATLKIRIKSTSDIDSPVWSSVYFLQYSRLLFLAPSARYCCCCESRVVSNNKNKNYDAAMLRALETRRGGAQDRVQVPEVGLPEEILRVLQQGGGLLGEVQLRRLQEHARPQLRVPPRRGRAAHPSHRPEAPVAAAAGGPLPAAEGGARSTTSVGDGRGSGGIGAEDAGGGGGGGGCRGGAHEGTDAAASTA